MIKLPLLLTLEKTINAYIHLDECCQKKLKKLSGRVFGAHVSGLNLTLYFLFLDKEIKLQSELIGEPDVFVKCPPFTLMRIFTSDEPNAIFHEDQVEVEGDMALAQEVKQFFDDVDIDWAGHLSSLTGDVIAQQAENFLSNNTKRAKDFSEHLKQNINEYLQEELNVLPPKEEVEDFFEDLAQLRDRVERLDLSVKRATKR